MKKFIALALALAMMVSCLVFTASAEDNGVAVTLQGPTTVAENGTFQVKVRVTDTDNIVGGVQGVVKVTGATVAGVEVNPELNTWNKTEDVKTIYKNENNVVTFASLNKLKADTYDTRVWFIIDYKVATDATKVSVTLENVKVSNKDAKAVATATSGLDVDVIDTAVAPNVSLTKAGIDAKTTKYLANDQAMLVYAGVKNIDSEDITDIGVVFYPTGLLGGKELTIGTDDAIVANVNKAAEPELFAKIASAEYFIGALEFNFSSEELARKFLGTLVTARVYYKAGDKVVYASNASESPYISNGTVSKAALNTILDNADGIEEPTFGTTSEYSTARNGLNTGNTNWYDNRGYVLEYCVKNLGSN